MKTFQFIEDCARGIRKKEGTAGRVYFNDGTHYPLFIKMIEAGDAELAEWAGISEEEFNRRQKRPSKNGKEKNI